MLFHAAVSDVDECAEGSHNCTQLCTNTVSGFTCSCLDGYTLHDNWVCNDDDECADGSDNCAQLCTNTVGGFNCSCWEGYTLHGNGWFCHGPKVDLYVEMQYPRVDVTDFGHTETLCRPSLGDLTLINGYHVGIKLDTGYGTNINYLAGYQYESIGPSASRYGLRLFYDAGNFRVNAFSCLTTRHGLTREVIGMTLLTTAYFHPESFTVTVNINETATLSMFEYNPAPGGHDGTTEWRKDGSVLAGTYTNCTMAIDNVQMSDEGLYECYYTGRYSDHKQGIMRLIVRECPEGKWGPPGCTSPCEECYNGVCDDETGECICVPGFGGLHCDIGCPDGYFGDSCISLCAQYTCQNKIVCGPDPLGCRCIAGFQGSFCNTQCSDGTYGSDCQQTCHCANGTNVCSRYTGVCSSGGCAAGWEGTSCHIDIDECSLGTDGCDHVCENVPGNFTCSCWVGYVMDSGTCVDVDECSLNTDKCEQTCHNHVGNYTCSCSEGYFLSSNGWNCTDVDECVEGSDNCTQLCTNTVGGFNCSCWDGYTLHGNGWFCQDVDECSLNTDKCEQTCHNQAGNYTCSCSVGYVLTSNGWNCTEPLTSLVISATQQAHIDASLSSDDQHRVYFAINHEISLEVLQATGDIETLNWVLDGITTTLSINLAEGAYTVTATAVNEISEISANLTLNVVECIHEVRLFHVGTDGPLPGGEALPIGYAARQYPARFLVLVRQVGYNATYVASVNGGDHFEIPTSVDSNQAGNLMSYQGVIPYNLSDYHLETFTLTFQNQGQYHVVVNGTNVVSEAAANVSVTALVTSPAEDPKPGTFTVWLMDSNPPMGMFFDASYGHGFDDLGFYVGDQYSSMKLEFYTMYSSLPGARFFIRVYKRDLMYGCIYPTQEYQSYGLNITVFSAFSGIHNGKLLYEGVNMTGQGPDKSIFPGPPHLMPVNFEYEVSHGTEDDVHMSWWFIGNEVVGEELKLSITFREVGTYAVTAMVFNNHLALMSGEFQVDIYEAITNVYVASNDPVLLGETVTFAVFATSPGTNSTFLLQLSEEDQNPVMLTPPSKGTNSIGIVESTFQGINFPFKLSDVYVTLYSFVYPSSGTYRVQVNATNAISTAYAETMVTVHQIPCFRPRVDIQDDGTSTIANPTAYTRDHDIALAATIQLNCTDANLRSFKWKAYTMSGFQSIPYPSNEAAISYILNGTEIIIPKHTLGYGRYILEFSVTEVHKVNGTDVVISNSDYTWFEIVESALVTRISGGSLISRGQNSTVKVDASRSYDPDVPESESTSGLTYTWACRLDNETFPNDTGSAEWMEGGCLGVGKSWPVTNNTDPVLVIPGGTLDGGTTYVFRITVSKPGRQVGGHAEKTVVVVEGFPPALEGISCVQNCQQYLNPSDRLVLKAKCTDCTPESRLQYYWSLVNNPVNSKQWIDWDTDTLTGRQKTYLSIHKDTFKSGAGTETYTIRLDASDKRGESTYALYSFITNIPPTLGTCTVVPDTGTVMETLFQVTCSGFSDVNLPLTYRFAAISGVATSTEAWEQGTMVYYGTDSTSSPLYLPVGDKDNDFVVTIAIRVTDSIGESTETTTTATVLQGEMKENVSTVITTTESTVDTLLKAGNSQAAVQLLTSVSSAMSLDTTTGQEDKKQLRKGAITSLNRIPIQTLDGLHQTATAMAQLTKEDTELSGDAQDLAVSKLTKMTTFLKAKMEDGTASVQAVEFTAHALISGLANVVKAAARRTSTAHDHFTPKVFPWSSTVIQQSLQTISTVKQTVLTTIAPGEKPKVLTTPSLAIMLQRDECRDFRAGAYVQEDFGSLFSVPSCDDLFRNGTIQPDQVIDMHMTHFSNNPYQWATNISLEDTVVSLEFTSEGQNIAVRNLTEAVDIILPRDDSSEFWNTVRISGDGTTELQDVTTFNTTDIHENQTFHVLLRPSNPDAELTLYLGEDQYPTSVNYTSKQSLPLTTDYTLEVSEDRNITADPFLWRLGVLNSSSTYYIGISYSVEDYLDLELLVFTSSCTYFDETTSTWQRDGCQLGPLTTSNRTHCICDHLTSFGSTFFSLANDVAVQTQADAADDIPIIPIAVASAFALYLVVASWVYFKDKEDKVMVETMAAKDRDPLAHYQYDVTVVTGFRRNAGTSGNVNIRLIGDYGESELHTISDPLTNRKVLQRGSIDSFLITTRDWLGEIKEIAIRMDNVGKSQSWYLSRVMVRDLQTDQWWHFLSNRWLTTDENRREIEIHLPVTDENELRQALPLFVARALFGLRNDHLWFSILTRSPRSRYDHFI
ncbi:PKDREJ [Branchiostoma lanceolatum]|uniref:PKDREJ protein n=1 Tax=Branchiostoma lanceolatum TaxID=7740 RepID=A0A8K0E763_BRALA|nr:PKDREJ [Branchiostoma lanceolatum]